MYNGVEWETYDNPLDATGGTAQLNAVATDNDSDVWFGTDGGLTFYDGTNWITYTTSNSGISHNRVKSIVVDSENNKWAGTEGGGLVKFDGNEWIVYNKSNSGIAGDKIISLAIDSESNKWIGSKAAGLNKFDGTNWIKYLAGETIYDINFDKEGNVWACTDNGVAVFNNVEWIFYNSTNSGLSNNSVRGIDFDSYGDKWIVTYGGGFYHFDDNNWVNYNRNNSPLQEEYISSIIVEANGNKLIGTEGGGLLIYNENGVVVSVEEELEEYVINSYALEQNYPNPFNPSTGIRYEIGDTRFVTLKVYDVLGREVAVLVNEQLSAGSYEVEFDAESLTSGIYFYKLQSGSFIESRKMMLIK